MHPLDRASCGAVGLIALPPQRSPALAGRPPVVLLAATAKGRWQTWPSACSADRYRHPESCPFVSTTLRAHVSARPRTSSHHRAQTRQVDGPVSLVCTATRIDGTSMCMGLL